jgi:aminopeptidase N
VIAGASVESDPDVLAMLLAQARIAAALWACDEGLLRRLAGACRDHVSTATQGSDVQLTWAKAWFNATDDIAALTALLDGSAPPGITVDTELRWHVVRRLAVLGGQSADDLAAELARDRTAAGQRHADYALAARPDPRAKEQAWTAAITDPSLSNHATEARARGFWQLGQEELCRPYAERFFREIEAAWAARTPQVAKSLATHLYPSVLVEPAVLDLSDAFLAGRTVPAGLRRVVLERRDDLRRALAARVLSRA